MVGPLTDCSRPMHAVYNTFVADPCTLDVDPFDTIARVKELANATGCSLYAPRTQGIRVLEDSSTLECYGINDHVTACCELSHSLYFCRMFYMTIR